ncbi:MAG: hypothetical protein M1839_003713 [Geoglossum umbratile]|nr:MAG: hypothetical protein M1839_003713 [Geoglossum umbratile]
MNPNTNPNTNQNTNPNTNPSTNPNITNTGTHSNGGPIGSLKTAVRGVHGASDVLRGSINQAVDTAFGNHEAAARHKAVTEKGLGRMGYSGVSSGAAPVGGATSQQQPLNQAAFSHTANVDPATGTADRNGQVVTGGTTMSDAANPQVGFDRHGQNIDPATGIYESTTTAGHGPRIGSDRDGREDPAVVEQRTAAEPSQRKNPLNPSAIDFKFWKKDKGDRRKGDDTGAVVEGNANQDNPASTNYGPHPSSIENTLDPRVDSDRDGQAVAPTGNPVGNKLDPRIDPDRDNGAAAPHTGDGQRPSHPSQQQYQQPPLAGEYGSGAAEGYGGVARQPGTSKFAERLGAGGTETGTGAGEKSNNPFVGDMD